MEEKRDDSPKKGAKENLYDKIPLSVRQLDVIIVLLVVAIIGAIIYGALKGKGMLP